MLCAPCLLLCACKAFLAGGCILLHWASKGVAAARRAPTAAAAAAAAGTRWRRQCTRLQSLALNCAIFDHDLTLDRLAQCTTIEARSCSDGAMPAVLYLACLLGNA